MLRMNENTITDEGEDKSDGNESRDVTHVGNGSKGMNWRKSAKG